jgi:hypothetical protein
MPLQSRGSFTDESEGFLSQYLVYLQAYQIEPLGFDVLPEYKPGKFSKSPKVCFPNVKFSGLEIVHSYRNIHRASFNSSAINQKGSSV